MGQHQNRSGEQRTWDRFDAKVMLIPFSDCHYWTGAQASHGYGDFKINGRRQRAHRVAYERHHGPIAEGLVVRHRCDQPMCVNPAHLSLGTQADNMRDAAERNRMPSGDRHHNARLSDAEVEQVLALAASGEQTGAIATRFNVSRALVSTLRHGAANRSSHVSKPTGRTDRRLTDSAAKAIYARSMRGERRCDLAAEYGVKPSFISDIKRGVTYASVTGHRR